MRPQAEFPTESTDSGTTKGFTGPCSHKVKVPDWPEAQAHIKALLKLSNDLVGFAAPETWHLHVEGASRLMNRIADNLGIVGRAPVPKVSETPSSMEAELLVDAALLYASIQLQGQARVRGTGKVTDPQVVQAHKDAWELLGIRACQFGEWTEKEANDGSNT